MDNFRCQIAVGTLTSVMGVAGFKTRLGMQCQDGTSPQAMFNKLIDHYNTLASAQELVANGDVVTIGTKASCNTYQTNLYGDRIGASFTCVKDSEQFAKYLGFTPCLFLFCESSLKWYFFTYCNDYKTSQFIAKAFDVEALASRRVDNLSIIPELAAAEQAGELETA